MFHYSIYGTFTSKVLQKRKFGYFSKTLLTSNMKSYFCSLHLVLSSQKLLNCNWRNNSQIIFSKFSFFFLTATFSEENNIIKKKNTALLSLKKFQVILTNFKLLLIYHEV